MTQLLHGGQYYCLICSKTHHHQQVTDKCLLKGCVSVMSVGVSHLVLQELVHTAIVSNVPQQHLSSFNPNFICIYSWNTSTHVLYIPRWCCNTAHTHTWLYICSLITVCLSPFFPRAEPANMQPVEDSAMILKTKEIGESEGCSEDMAH